MFLENVHKVVDDFEQDHELEFVITIYQEVDHYRHRDGCSVPVLVLTSKHYAGEESELYSCSVYYI